MKMNKSLIALCLSAGLLASAPGISLADVNYVPQNTSDAPAIPSAALQQLTWTPVDQSKTQTTQLATGGQQLNVPRHQWSGCCVQRPGKHWRTDPDADQRSEQTNQRFCAERADS
ncbi:maltose regulon periplasmic protein [Escherichia coli]|uniref:Maltose regulon periplasmic protein n=1 Tax=Escherichia coli TaxID=562 RepID=A0A376L3B4_ECOLX|nr:maltose regulon periplasmic protein [Escherichia coli]